MTYLQRSSIRKTGKLKKLIILFLFLLLIFILQNARGAIVRPLYFVAVPVWKIDSAVSDLISKIFVVFASKQQMQEEIIALREKIVTSELQHSKVRQFIRENEELKGEISKADENSILSYVLTRPPASPFDTFVLSKGSLDGVEKGMRVVLNGVAFGKIEEVYGRTSKAVLFSAPGQETEVVLVNSGTARLIAKGKGGGNFLLELPKGIPVEKGESVLLQGGESVLGIIGEIESRASDPFDRVYLAYPFNIFDKHFVLIER